MACCLCIYLSVFSNNPVLVGESLRVLRAEDDIRKLKL